MTEPLFEFDEARRLIKEGAKAYFRELREKRPEQVIYTYAITGSEDAPALGLAANSEQGYEKVLAGYRDDTSFRETLKEMGLEFSPFDYRWRFPEWVFGGGAQHMGPVSDILEAVELEKEDPGPETDVEFKDQSMRRWSWGCEISTPRTCLVPEPIGRRLTSFVRSPTRRIAPGWNTAMRTS